MKMFLSIFMCAPSNIALIHIETEKYYKASEVYHEVCAERLLLKCIHVLITIFNDCHPYWDREIPYLFGYKMGLSPL